PGAVAHLKPPGVPRAGDCPLFVQMARPERGPLVGAKVVDGEVLAGVIEQRYHVLPDLERASLSGGNRADLCNGDKIGHDDAEARGERWGVGNPCSALGGKSGDMVKDRSARG